MCKVHPRDTKCTPSQFYKFFGQFLLDGLDFEVYLDGLVLGRRLKKSSTFWGKKVHPRRQNPGYAPMWIGLRVGSGHGFRGRSSGRVGSGNLDPHATLMQTLITDSGNSVAPGTLWNQYAVVAV